MCTQKTTGRYTLPYDAGLAFIFDGKFGIGLGSLIMVVNVVLLGLYSISCHSCRHLVGGRLNTFSDHPTRYKLWKLVTRLNESHMRWAWLSLWSVMLTDLYIRLCSMGVILDRRLL